MTEWIKCSERLPTYGDQIILVYTEDGQINKNFFFVNGKWQERGPGDFYGESKVKVTHWMTWPEAPHD